MQDKVTTGETDQVPAVKKIDSTADEEEVERDDFGLPLRKIKEIQGEKTELVSEGGDKSLNMDRGQGSGGETGSEALNRSKAPPEPLEISANSIEDDSEGEDEFKDATSTPITDAPTPRTSRLPQTAYKSNGGVANLEDEGNLEVSGDSAQDNKEVHEIANSEPVDDRLQEKSSGKEADENEKPDGIPPPAAISEENGILPAAESKRVLAEVEPNLKDIIKAQNGDKLVDSEVIKEQSQPSTKESSTSHQKTQSYTNGISEWSHQHMAPQAPAEKEDEDEGWQEMPAYAPFDMYDDDNRLIAREVQELDEDADADQGLGGAGKGYTRVQLDDDAQSATSLDEDTKYLFKEVNNTSAADLDDEQRDALSQMQATKDLLTEMQRIAYVGLTRLALSVMTKEADNIPTTKPTKKEVAKAAEAMKMWSQKMMVRLYTHMDISSEEQIMIEQLAEHDLRPSDLTPTLMQNARVRNPMAEKAGSSTASVTSPRPSSVFSGPRSPRSPTLSVPSPNTDHEEAAAPPIPYVDNDGEDMPEVRTPSQLPTTKNIDIDLRWTVLCDLFLTLIADSVYDARSRVVLERVGKYMGVEWVEICRFEKRVTDALEMQQAAEKENWNEEDHKENRRKMALNKRYVMMGLATVGGGLVIGLSAGLLAPVIGAGLAAGFTTIGVAGTSGFLASTSAAAIITSGAAASGGIIAVRAADRRTGAVKTFEYRPLHNNKRVNLIVTVSGWMTGKVDDVRLPYSTVDPVMGDIYSVLWEPEMLTSMGDTINILATEALTQGLQQVLGSTILIGLMSALQLPVVLTKLAYLIDNPWTVSLDRANAAGLILADSLIDRNLGTRPITFVGYSLGSRVIFSCLKELARKGAYGLVQNVYLFGSPIVANKDDYTRARTVVSGRFVNGYARTDWILGYLFRLTSGGISRVAGLAPIEGIPGIENVDVTEFVPGHMSYRKAMPRLLREVGWLVESDEFTEIEDPDPENHQQRQRELINEIEEARKELDKEGKKGKLGGIFGRKKKKAPEREEWETYQESKDDASGNGKKGPQGDYGGVLFDVDAIRAELASEHMEVKELQSTLPPMKLDISSPRQSLQRSQSIDASTKLRPSPTVSPNLPQTGFKAGPSTSPRFAPPPRLQTSPTPSYHNGNGYGSSVNLYSYGEADHHGREEIQMTFDNSPVRPAFDPSPPKAEPSDRMVAARRPELKTSSTLPLAASTLPVIAVDTNAWVDDEDDEDFGQEKEMEMTFA